MGRIPYEFTRDSVAALIKPHGESRLVQPNIPVVGYPGVRGGGGFLIMPAVTQIFYDNYFSNQTLDAAIGSPWTPSGTVEARDENTLIGYSAECGAGKGVYIVLQTAAVHTVSAFFYVPPPATLTDISFYNGNGASDVVPDQIISLGGYWYFAWVTVAGQNGASDRWGPRNDNASGHTIWVSCPSLTATTAPVGFVPNSQTAATQASADDNLKFTLSEPLPQSGSISFVYVPFYEDADKAVDDYPTILSFYPSGGNFGGSDDYMQFRINDNDSEGFYAEKRVGGGSGEQTIASGYAATGFKAFEPIEIVVRWDFTPGGTKMVLIDADGELQVESDNWDEGFPTNLVDMWVGVERQGAATWRRHAQGIVQDVQIHRR